MSLDDERNDGPYGGSGETRTRLPEGEGGGQDGYGGPRRSGRSSSRSLVTVVGVVVLLIAAIAFANRGGEEGSSGGGGGDKKAGADPTAASGEKPVDGKTAGIPSGFAKSEQGVQSAASNYAVALVSADILKPARRTEIVRQIFVPDRVDALEQEFAKTYSKEFLTKVGLDANGNSAPGETYVSRTLPVGTKTTAYADTSATVQVWCTGAFGTAGQKTTNPVSNDWFTMTFKLRWSGGDWKVERYSSKDGPSPVNGDNKVSTADEIAKAVQEYGGFTYAR
ncbi:hypothetical protein GCM10009837_86540 [Streptomyces durmitorensis]|uniref:DUF8175 domain-containing protein n=1 Tax=Streptomyces durmitorensis TaxID=319947 RepID=A0ABY4PV34_9ACTN|nr:hypothetical protein [Streptomyces durmitorensis]UQT57692.1 hypothetical protein M4V62_22790 [Streptomyces durmitorensis]